MYISNSGINLDISRVIAFVDTTFNSDMSVSCSPFFNSDNNLFRYNHRDIVSTHRRVAAGAGGLDFTVDTFIVFKLKDYIVAVALFDPISATGNIYTGKTIEIIDVACRTTCRMYVATTNVSQSAHHTVGISPVVTIVDAPLLRSIKVAILITKILSKIR